MARYFDIHPANPQRRAIAQVAGIVRDGGVIAYPTDSCYALGCQLGNFDGIERIRLVRHLDDRHHLTLVCQDFAQLGQFVHVPNRVFRPSRRRLRVATRSSWPRRRRCPSPPAPGEDHRRADPDHLVTQALLAELGEPLVSSTLLLPGQDDPMTQGWEINEQGSATPWTR